MGMTMQTPAAVSMPMHKPMHMITPMTAPGTILLTVQPTSAPRTMTMTPPPPRRAGNGPGRLLLIPTPLQQPEESGTWLLEADRARVAALAHFYVETPKTARRWLGVLGLERPMQELSLHVLPDRAGKGKQAAPEARDPAQWLAPLLAGEDAGLLSDAGCPGWPIRAGNSWRPPMRRASR